MILLKLFNLKKPGKSKKNEGAKNFSKKVWKKGAKKLRDDDISVSILLQHQNVVLLTKKAKEVRTDMMNNTSRRTAPFAMPFAGVELKHAYLPQQLNGKYFPWLNN